MDLPHIADLWPALDPAYGNVTLRAFRPEDAGMALELSRDPYVPATGTLPLDATPDQAQQWIRRQQARHTEGTGFSFAVVDNTGGHCAGFTGLWVRELHAGRATVGYLREGLLRSHQEISGRRRDMLVYSAVRD